MLGRKGYILKKEDLDEKTINEIKHELTVVPLVKINYGTVTPNQFKIYRETKNKLYLPRYYGLTKFGRPKIDQFEEEKITEIDVKFNAELRDYQKIAFNTVQTKLKQEKGGILSVNCGWGKCLGKDTEILMYSGRIKKVQNIKANELIMGDDSTPRRVLTVCTGREQMYQIQSGIHDSYIVNESHILSLKDNGKVIDISVRDYLKQKLRLKGYKVGVLFQTRSIRDNPFSVGSRVIDEIPEDYKINSVKIRKAVLLGILYKYGSYDKKIMIKVRSEKLKDDIIFLIRSLGIPVVWREVLRLTGRIDKSFEIEIIKKNNLYDIDIIALKIDNYYGFEIDGNRRFVLGNFTVTHNTVFALKLACSLKLKTLIIVHKEFLLNQWKERIEEFTDGKIGLIQQNKVDIEDKDFVIGMLQSISMKDYPKEVFDNFGLTIVDECHCIATESFSRALKKIHTPYNLGLSATPERADGLSKVFKWNLGDILYQERQKRKAEVIVYHYKNIEVERKFDYRGVMKFSTMLSELTQAVKRNQFILNLLPDLVKTERKILILSHSRDHLSFLKQRINEEKIATCGLYMGKMKNHELEHSKKQQILLGTYSMIAEAFDHKVLSILIMVTPRVSIEQSVGRILRDKNVLPMVIDIADSILIHQYKKRKKFYLSCKYDITEITSSGKIGMKVKEVDNGRCRLDDSDSD